MDNEDKAWETFSKADVNQVADASAQGMLQAIMAEINSIKADTAKLASQADTGAVDAGGDVLGGAAEEGMPPMDEGMGAPMGEAPAEGGAPMGEPMGEPVPEAAGPSFADQVSEQPDSYFLDLLRGESDSGAPMGGESTPEEGSDPTLDALQDALAKAKDPEVIANLAGMIQEYIAKAGAGAPEVAPELPPEVIMEALAGAAPEEGAPAEEAVAEEVPEEALDEIMKSETVAKTEEGQQDQEPGMEDAPSETAQLSMNDDRDTAGPVECSDEEEECDPAIVIKIFLGSTMDDIMGDNVKNGLSDENKSTEPFKAYDDGEAKPVKKSIEDVMNERLRSKCGVDGKTYKVSKSANELRAEKIESIKKSISSYGAAKNMHVKDVLSTMWGLKKMGVSNVEKSYAPLVDEIVRYCDNCIGPQYTEPLFRAYSLDLSQVYEPLGSEAFSKGVRIPSSVRDKASAKTKQGLKLNAENDLARQMVNGMLMAVVGPDVWSASARDYMNESLFNPFLDQQPDVKDRIMKELNKKEFSTEDLFRSRDPVVRQLIRDAGRRFASSIDMKKAKAMSDDMYNKVLERIAYESWRDNLAVPMQSEDDAGVYTPSQLLPMLIAARGLEDVDLGMGGNRLKKTKTIDGSKNVKESNRIFDKLLFSEMLRNGYNDPNAGIKDAIDTFYKGRDPKLLEDFLAGRGTGPVDSLLRGRRVRRWGNLNGILNGSSFSPSGDYPNMTDAEMYKAISDVFASKNDAKIAAIGKYLGITPDDFKDVSTNTEELPTDEDRMDEFAETFKDIENEKLKKYLGGAYGAGNYITSLSENLDPSYQKMMDYLVKNGARLNTAQSGTQYLTSSDDLLNKYMEGDGVADKISAAKDIFGKAKTPKELAKNLTANAGVNEEVGRAVEEYGLDPTIDIYGRIKKPGLNDVSGDAMRNAFMSSFLSRDNRQRLADDWDKDHPEPKKEGEADTSLLSG